MTSATAASQHYWASFHQAVELAGRGAGRVALEILAALRVAPEKASADPAGNADYTYAAMLLSFATSVPEVREAIEILALMRAASENGRGTHDLVVLLNEEASGHIKLGEPDVAFELASRALDIAKSTHPALSLVLQNLGIAQFQMGRFGAARELHLRMIDVSLERGNMAHAGIAAEWLARIALAENAQADALAWTSLAIRAYRLHAPRHLQSLADLQVAFARSAPTPSPYTRLDPRAVVLDGVLAPLSDVGDRAGVHIDELGLDLGALYALADAPPDFSAWFGVPICVDGPGVNRLMALLQAESRSILPHDRKWETLSLLLNDLWPDRADRILDRLQANAAGDWEIERPKDHNEIPMLVWSASSALPMLYGPDLSALALLFQGAYLSRLDTISNLGISVNLINVQDRAWPRPVQFWMIAQGQAAAGGSRGPTHLAVDVTRVRLSDPAANRRVFEQICFLPDEAVELDKGGLVAVLASELSVRNGNPAEDIGTVPLNEMNAANVPNMDVATLSEDRPGLVIDRQYNALFFAPAPSTSKRAWYGKDNALFRDHFTAFREHLRIVGSVRSKHFSVPVADVADPDELDRLAKLLTVRGRELEASGHASNGGRMWYRGQLNAYPLSRPAVVSEYLYGMPDVCEPSLPGAAPRRGWNYLEVHSFLSVQLQAHLYRLGRERGEQVEETHARWRSFVAEPGKWDLGVMLLAQHYGIPTHGIDITHDLDVAVWFATHRFVEDAGRATYRKLREEQFGADPAKWPVVYVILPVTNSLKGAIRDVDLLEPFRIDALRPRRQSAAFFMGAHGLHKNRLAEALVCVLRLRPGNWPTRASYAGLFPNEREDSVYGWMLSLKRRFAAGTVGRFLAEIPDFALSFET